MILVLVKLHPCSRLATDPGCSAVPSWMFCQCQQKSPTCQYQCLSVSVADINHDFKRIRGSDLLLRSCSQWQTKVCELSHCLDVVLTFSCCAKLCESESSHSKPFSNEAFLSSRLRTGVLWCIRLLNLFQLRHAVTRMSPSPSPAYCYCNNCRTHLTMSWWLTWSVAKGSA